VLRLGWLIVNQKVIGLKRAMGGVIAVSKVLVQ